LRGVRMRAMSICAGAWLSGVAQPPTEVTMGGGGRMSRLDELLQVALPEVSRRGSAMVATIVRLRDGCTADDVARSVGLTNRYAVERLLRQEGLPSCAKLVGWISVLGWVLVCEDDSTSLCQLALSQGRDPAGYYRSVKRITGISWLQLRRWGWGWVVAELGRQCTGPRMGMARRPAVEARTSPCPAGVWIRGGDCLLHGSHRRPGARTGLAWGILLGCADLAPRAYRS